MLYNDCIKNSLDELQQQSIAASNQPQFIKLIGNCNSYKTVICKGFYTLILINELGLEENQVTVTVTYEICVDETTHRLTKS